ncbi:MAG: Tad domain-containing protein [Anaerolineales bacterium]
MKIPNHTYFQFAPGERGQAIVLLAMLIVGLLAAMAIAADGGLLYAQRRSMQNAADNGALAGALAICSGGDAVAAAEAAALANANGNFMSLQVNHPPLDGPNVGDNTYVEVQVETAQQAGFAQFVFDAPLVTSARAVGHCFQGDGPVGGGNVLLVLDPDNSCAFSATGNATIFLNLGGGGIYTNSNHANAMCGSGNALVDTDTGTFVVGGYSTSGNSEFIPQPVTGVPQLSDPLTSLIAPTNPGGACPNYSLSSTNTDTIDPGQYCSINISSNAVLTMNPGIYYISNGNFTISGNASLEADEVMIYMAGGGNFSMSGNGTFDISAPASGAYQGLMVFMDRTGNGSITISGNGLIATTGTIYGAQSHMILAGNGSNTVMNAQVIVNTMAVSGNASMVINYDADLVFGGPGGADFIELAE